MNTWCVVSMGPAASVSGDLVGAELDLFVCLEGRQRTAQVAQWFGAAFSPGPDPGDRGSSPTSGSLHGACFSLCLCLCLSLCVSHEQIK